MFIDFLKYFLKAVNAHGIHSPFVYELYTKVYRDFSQNADFNAIEDIRNKLKDDQRKLTIHDFGAGSRLNSSTQRTVSDIAKKSLKSRFWGQFLYRIIKHYNYTQILELGTSLGITTSYLAKANAEAKVWTLEGCTETQNIAKENFSKLNVDPQIVSISGNIDDNLQKVLDGIEQLDFVLFDANHKLEPTLRYFEQCLSKAHENTVFVFDDIYWSKEMKQAWTEICTDKRVSISIDFFHMGLVFFREGKEKQHFILK